MIFEILLIAGGLFYGGNAIRDAMGSKPALLTSTAVPALPEPVVGDTAELVIELFRTDDGWKRLHDRTESGVSLETWEHVTGVKVTNRDYHGYTYGYQDSYTFIYIKSDNGAYEGADASEHDCKLIRKELEAFKTRQRNSKQRALTRVLAKRIVDRESGVQPLLGSSSNSGSDDASSVDGERADDNSVPAGLLVYDDTRKQVVTIGAGGDRLTLDAALRKRYGVRPSTLLTNNELITLSKRVYSQYSELNK